ncbi:hypothetical protein V6N13_123744 [Hibiscus sabdariffa]|uniref:Uncharacterized protein n=2 Tax=Hibiscus sabdariffa TaxID=183260 RepID=A0ABR1ZFL0_9ROSI
MAPSSMQLVMSLMSSTLLSTPDKAPSLIQHAPSPSTTIKPSSSTSMLSLAQPAMDHMTSPHSSSPMTSLALPAMLPSVTTKPSLPDA